MTSWQLQWDKDYGANKRRGFSISINGHFVAELTCLPIAVFKAISFLLRGEAE